MLFSGKIPFHVAARLTPRFWVPHYSHYSRLLALYDAYYSLFGTIRCSLFATIKLFAIRVFQTPGMKQGMKVGEVFSVLIELLDERVTQASHVGKRGDNDVFETNLFNLLVNTERKYNVNTDFSLRSKPSLCPYA